MNNNLILEGEILRIKEIMGFKINEAESSPGPWYLKLIEDFIPIASRIPGAVDELINFKFMVKNAKSEQELDNLAKMLFSKDRPYYNDLIPFVKTNYQTVIEKGTNQLVELGQRLMDSGMPLEQTLKEIDNAYPIVFKGSYMGEELASEIKNVAKEKVTSYSPVQKPIITDEDLQKLINSYKDNKEFSYLFEKFGPQIEMELKQAQEIFKVTKNYSEFSRQVDQAVALWKKNHPAPKGTWEKIGNWLKKTFITENKKGGMNIPVTIFKNVMIAISVYWLWRGVRRVYWGESVAEAFIRAAGEDVAGIGGAIIEFFSALFKGMMGKKPSDIKGPEDFSAPDEGGLN